MFDHEGIDEILAHLPAGPQRERAARILAAHRHLLVRLLHASRDDDSPFFFSEAAAAYIGKVETEGLNFEHEADPDFEVLPDGTGAMYVTEPCLGRRLQILFPPTGELHFDLAEG